MEHKKFDIVIGLEIHAELNTKTKLLCGCKNEYGSKPNSNICPICLAWKGHTGTLNKSAIEKTIRAGLTMGCEINEQISFERKFYSYPDLPSGFQLSQLEKPICVGGGIKLKNGQFKRLNRIHLEADAGKLIHNDVLDITMIDLNRFCVPLIEIVTEPDFASANEVIEFLEAVRSRLVYSGVADCKMEEGGLRCDVNLSLKPKGSKEYGVRTEMKNINSFRAVNRAIIFEANRQAELLTSGGTVICETRKWDDVKGKSTSMRAKETEEDYGYLPDPTVPKIIIPRDTVEKIANTMPVLAHQLNEKFITEYKLPEYDAEILTRDKVVSHFFLDCVKLLDEPKHISNWILTDIMKRMKDGDTDIIPTTPEALTKIIKMVIDGKVNKIVGLDMLDGKVSLDDTCGVSDEQIMEILNQVKTDKPNLVNDYTANPQKVLPFLIGQVMKQTKGKAKSDVIENLIKKVFQ